MKFATVLTSTLLLFSIIISKTDATCDDCQTLASIIVSCDMQNKSTCGVNSILDSSTSGLIDCCNQQPLYDLWVIFNSRSIYKHCKAL